MVNFQIELKSQYNGNNAISTLFFLFFYFLFYAFSHSRSRECANKPVIPLVNSLFSRRQGKESTANSKAIITTNTERVVLMPYSCCTSCNCTIPGSIATKHIDTCGTGIRTADTTDLDQCRQSWTLIASLFVRFHNREHTCNTLDATLSTP